MRFSVFDQWGARNSTAVWHAFRTGALRLGHQVVSHDTSADVAVIWSQVWTGRMRHNHAIWQQFRAAGRPVIVLEVGTLQRGVTWKMGLNGTNAAGRWGRGIDSQRPRRLGINPMAWRDPGDRIVIVMQRHDSEQWIGQPPMHVWLANTVEALHKVTDRPIQVRRHPRQSVTIPQCCEIDQPVPVANTYDDFNLESGLSQAWAVINHNSGAGVRAVLSGVPVFVSNTSLAAPVGNLDWGQIENPQKPDRSQWLVDVSHTEWTREEIASGYPLSRLLLDL